MNSAGLNSPSRAPPGSFGKMPPGSGAKGPTPLKTPLSVLSLPDQIAPAKMIYKFTFCSAVVLALIAFEVYLASRSSLVNVVYGFKNNPKDSDENMKLSELLIELNETQKLVRMQKNELISLENLFVLTQSKVEHLEMEAKKILRGNVGRGRETKGGREGSRAGGREGEEENTVDEGDMDDSEKAWASWQARLDGGRFGLHSFHPVSAGDPATWRQHVFSPHGMHSFLQFSAHRIGVQKIAILGLADSRTVPNMSLGSCEWRGSTGQVIVGSISHVYEPYHDGKRYTTAILFCNLDAPTGDAGGHLVALVDNEESVFFREEAGQVQGNADSFRYERAYCGAPMHGPQDAEMILQWIKYHRANNFMDKMILYEINSIDEKVERVLEPYVKMGLTEIVNISALMSFEVFYFGQTLMIHDCIFRLSLQSRWVFLHDFDEYLEILPPHTLNSILDERKDHAWISHGAIYWDISRCIEGEEGGEGDGEAEGEEEKEFLIERMVFRHKQPYCFDSASSNTNLCEGWRGHRKLFVNPRKITYQQVHKVLIYEGMGENLNASSHMRHNHFRGLNTLDDGGRCRRLVREGEGEGEGGREGDVEWQRDDHFADEVARLRRSLSGTTSETNSNHQ